MIKLFGWESRMSAKLAEKREDELSWIRKNKILSVIYINLGYALPLFASK